MKTVLITEDDMTVCQDAALACCRHDYYVIQAGHGIAGLELAIASRFHLVLNDVNLPGCDGLNSVILMTAKPTSTSMPKVLSIYLTDSAWTEGSKSDGTTTASYKTMKQ
jgi:DNA-binding response OmpR family regulator